MRDAGYAYAIIGGVGPAEYYARTVGATLIEGVAATPALSASKQRRISPVRRLSALRCDSVSAVPAVATTCRTPA